MKTIQIIQILFIVVAILGCSDNEVITAVNIRLANASDVDFRDMTFNGEDFGDLAPGEKSEYRAFERSYSYGSVSIIIEGERFGWQPNDFVGEELLATGDYTFEYSFDPVTRILTDKLVRD